MKYETLRNGIANLVAFSLRWSRSLPRPTSSRRWVKAVTGC